MTKRRVRDSFLLVVTSIFFWESSAFIVGSQTFPHFWDVFPDLLQLLQSNGFWREFFLTCGITFLGFFTGLSLATIVGFALALFPMVKTASEGTIDFIRSIPSVVFLPLLIASIGSSADTAVIVTSLVVSFLLIPYVARSILATEPQLVETAHALRLSRRAKILYLYLPSAISLLGTGMRLGASRAFGTVIAAGIVAGTPGLGAQLHLAETNAQMNRVFSYVLIMGFMGVGIYSIFRILENRFFKWRTSI